MKKFIYQLIIILSFCSIVYAGSIFTEDWADGTKDAWDDSSVNLTVVDVGGYILRRVHVQSTTSTGSCDKGFADNGVSGFQTLSSSRVNDATLECDIEFSTNSFPTDGSTKIMIIESWPGSTYPSTADKDFQAIVEVTGQVGHVAEFIITIKREDWDFFTRYQTSPITVTADTTYTLKLRIKLDAPYTESNGVLQFWIDDVLKIDNDNEDFILTSRGSDLPKGLNAIMLTGYTGGSGSPDNKNQYWDNIELSDADNGASLQGISIMGIEKK